MPKIILKILCLLTEIHECGNLNTVLVRSTAMSSIFGRQNIQHVGRLLRNLAL